MDNLDQLSSLLAPILNDPDAMEGIAQAAAQLGLGDLLGSGPSPAGASVEDRENASSDSGETDSDAVSGNSSRSSSVSGAADMTDMLGRIMPLISGGGKQDNSTRLLAALRPFLHGSRAKRLEDAERIVKLMSTVELLRQQGLI